MNKKKLMALLSPTGSPPIVKDMSLVWLDTDCTCFC